MTSIKISQLPALGTANDNIEFLINDGGVPKKVTRATLSGHSHTNKPTLDKFGENAGGDPTYNGNDFDMIVAQRDVYDGLDSTDNTVSLAASQGKVLNDKIIANALIDPLPNQTSQSGKFLTTDGSSPSWGTVDALPNQTGQDGKYLTTNSGSASWAVLDTDANTTTKGLYEHSNTINSNYTIGVGNNAIAAGPLNIASGSSITIPTGSTFVIA